jgi:hypothetical protein
MAQPHDILLEHLTASMQVQLVARLHDPDAVGNTDTTYLHVEVFQSCGYATLSQTQRHPKRSEGSDDYPSAALSLLRRDRYRPTWHVA